MSLEREQGRAGRVRWMVSIALTVMMGWGCTAVAAGAGSPAQGERAKPTPLIQGWDEKLRNQYYFTPQGSRMMPYAWFMALERADSTELFASPGSMSRYDWVYPLTSSSELNPGGLPVGFIKEDVGIPGVGPSVGMNCAACHTNDITYNGRAFRVDGAPTLADFPLFIVELSEALVDTAKKDEKFRRFAARIAPTQVKLADAGDNGKTKELKALKVLLTSFASEFSGRAAMYAALPPGRGRLDALTQIVNSMAVIDLGRPDNLRLPSAPVSYPHLWLAPKLDFV
jgi:hypothetical protein